MNSDNSQEVFMLKRLLIIAAIGFSSAILASGQNSNSSTTLPTSPSTRTRTIAAQPSPTPKKSTATQGTTAANTRTPKTEAAGQVSPSAAVLAAFNNLLDGIRHADVKAATNAY